MRTSTIDNINNRFVWLKGVLAGEIAISESDQKKLSDMRTFCELEISGMFGRVSYNTLKTSCLRNAIPGVSFDESTQWDQIIYLRKMIHETYSKAKPAAKNVLKPSEKLQINAALNQAQLTSIAYLEMFRFLKGMLEAETVLPDAVKQQISNYLYESSQKFEDITSFDPAPHKKWSIIQGGKTDD
ncbi:hypothetical protein [Pseudomonas syringae]|uniref:hypothetical protein n=1 Tax=Pseudomonas TaxID=286 RepID=UPI001F0F5E26|nr:hypothetical protein [Pseudomonas syringae]MCH5518693.1 hypothetical protein [Pseudomonas syringae pv. lapsa]